MPFQYILGEGEEFEEISEEIANTATHFFGFIFSAAFTYLMIASATSHKRSWHHLVSTITFGSSLILLYACSTTYHFIGIHFNKQRDVLEKWQLLDHVAIYFLIAGSYTPLVLLVLVRREIAPRVGYAILIFIWVLAFLGAGTKILFSTAVVSEELGIAFYLLMGWSALLAAPYFRVIPYEVVKWVLYGGLSYSFGIYFLVSHHIHFNHMVWHLFVMTGSLLHAVGVIVAIHIDDVNPIGKGDVSEAKSSVSEAIRHVFSYKEPHGANKLKQV